MTFESYLRRSCNHRTKLTREWSILYLCVTLLVQHHLDIIPFFRANARMCIWRIVHEKYPHGRPNHGDRACIYTETADYYPNHFFFFGGGGCLTKVSDMLSVHNFLTCSKFLTELGGNIWDLVWQIDKKVQGLKGSLLCCSKVS